VARAIHSGYFDGTRRGRQVRRVHILREEGPWAGKQGLCGQGVYKVTNSTPVVIDPMPCKPPDGLSWCPKCVGHLAERLGVLDKVAAGLAALAEEAF
jgi:hypothetical protein